MDHPAVGKIKYPGMPFTSSAVPPTDNQAAPLLGQNNEEIYSGILGYSKEDLVKLREAGVI